MHHPGDEEDEDDSEEKQHVGRGDGPKHGGTHSTHKDNGHYQGVHGAQDSSRPQLNAGPGIQAQHQVQCRTD